MVGGLGFAQSISAYLDGMQALLPAAFMVGLARSISLVLTDGHVVDSILNTLASPARAFARGGYGVSHGAGAGARARRRTERQRSGGVDDAADGAARRPAGVFAAGAGARVSSRRRVDGTLLTHQRRASWRFFSAASVPYERWLRFAASGDYCSTARGTRRNRGSGVVGDLRLTETAFRRPQDCVHRSYGMNVNFA